MVGGIECVFYCCASNNFSRNKNKNVTISLFHLVILVVSLASLWWIVTIIIQFNLVGITSPFKTSQLSLSIHKWHTHVSDKEQSPIKPLQLMMLMVAPCRIPSFRFHYKRIKYKFCKSHQREKHHPSYPSLRSPGHGGLSWSRGPNGSTVRWIPWHWCSLRPQGPQGRGYEFNQRTWEMWW